MIKHYFPASPDKTEEDLIFQIKDSFFANIQVGQRDDGTSYFYGGQLRSENELDAFDQWIDNECFDHEQLLFLAENPGEAERMFYESGKAQIVRTAMALDKLASLIGATNATIKITLAE